MKKIIFTTSLFALFASATMAELAYPIQVDNFTVIKEDINGEIIAQDNLTLQVSSTGSFGESLVYVQSNNANITKFTANGITTSATFAEDYKWLSLTGILNLESVKESYTLDNASFTNNSASTTNTTTGTYGSVLRTGKVSGTIQNSIFKGNYGYSNNQVQGTYSVGVAEKTLLNNVIFDSNTIESTNSQGGAIASFGSKEISINNSSFISNTASSQSQYAYGGAVYLRGAAWGGYADGVANISNTTFDKNTASSYSASQGGAIYIKSDITGIDAQNGKISTTLTDSVFTNNASVVEDKNSQYVYVSGGGAVYSYDSIVNFVATKDITNVGNYASIAGVKQDDRGGFLYLKSNALTATANFNISENATMTIGDGREGYDSIASENGTATINKTGVGSLVVNSSMQYFTGTLNVNAGTMEANNGLGANRVVVAKDSTFNANNWTVENQTVSVEGASSVLINGGILNTKGTSTLENVSFKNNTFTTTVDNLEGGNSGVAGGVVQISNGFISIDGGEISGNTMTAKGGSASKVYGGILYNANAKAETTLKNLTITDNLATGEWNVQGGVISMDNTASTLTIENSVIKNNTAEVVASAGTGFYGAMGGVICSLSATNHNTINVKETTFEGNSATNLITSLQLPYSGGGVAYLKGTMATFTDSTFKGNYVETTGAWDGGGAIYAYNGSVLTFNVSKSDTYVGNYVKADGVLSNELGGFVRLDGDATANFNVAENVTLAIGDGTAGYDSIAGSSSDTINKIGAGSLVVNGSMEYFKGALNVNEGSMVVNSVLGASDIVIANGATLTLGTDTDIILYGCSITLEDGATLELGSNSTITVNLEEDFTGSTNLFNVADGATLTQDGESVTLASLQENMTVTYNGQTLDNSQWSFDAETGELKAAVPEPSTYAMIFGAIALGFIAYRRRK